VLEAGIARLPDEPSLRESLRILLDHSGREPAAAPPHGAA